MTSSRCVVLIVEDDLEIRQTVADVLEDEGYEVQGAAHGREALERLPALADECVVLLDLMMPVMSGGELLAAMRADPRLADVPVVILSAWPQNDARLEGPIEGFLRKPVDIDELLATIARVCTPRAGALPQVL